MAITPTQLMTAEELLRLPDDGFRYELVRGELIKMTPPGFEHGGIVSKVIILLGQHVLANHLGMVVTEVGFQLARDPDTVRAPDAAFVRQERIQQLGKPPGYFPGPPDVAFEIISPNDPYTDVDEKVREWLSFGTRMVVVVNPRNHTITVHDVEGRIIRLTENDILDGGEVVRGWAIPVRDLFI